VIGLDLSLAMASKAAAGLRSLGVSNARVLQAQAEEIPLPDSSADWVVSNGIFNLSPEKERILKEIHRVLKPQGRLVCSEIVLPRDPTPEERNNQDDWFK
jgi:ubiquinone/menaquinone biosynthesis C-methylase UbiE